VIRDPARTALGNAVAACRRILLGRTQSGKVVEPGDIGEQLEAPFGFDKDTGAPKAIEQMGHLRAGQLGTARMLRAWHGHLKSVAAGKTDAERTRGAYDQMRHELGYTALHRLCALRMAEERRIVSRCVCEGVLSDGFRAWHQFAGPTLGPAEEAYSVFLDRLYDDLATDLPAVFDRRAAPSLVPPSSRATVRLLSVLAGVELVPLWRDDTTLGWIFEDWNDADERAEMRKHDAPRNARELAVRNQFFTPRWVVEFLTENTLGRWWLERCGESSALADSGRCRFLLPPTERSAERPDPRDIRVLDPACGSGHFLLYAYDLLQAIYIEAWERREHRSSGRKPLWEEWPDRARFVSELPGLILDHNLYGVDIDPRCVQEGALALWLRAQRSWDDLGVKPRERPRVRKVNLVCAQALGGDPAVKAKLLAGLKPAVLGRLLEALFAKAGEMGLLLRAETALADTVREVKAAYLEWKRAEKVREGEMFPAPGGPKQATIDDFAALREMGDETFWDEAETRLSEAITTLVEEATDERFGARLFAEDVRHGLEFFDVARMRFDVVLMNPPFGDPSESTKKALFADYPNSGNDLYAMFLVRLAEMLRAGGRIGAITSRSWIGMPRLAKFREHALGSRLAPLVVADLGFGVLNAAVETAAAVFADGGESQTTWIRVVKAADKESALQAAIAGLAPNWRFEGDIGRFKKIPGRALGYWMSDRLIALCASPHTAPRAGVESRHGVSTGDDPRYVRLAWEVPSGSSSWARHAKGGDYRPFFDDVHMAIRCNEVGGARTRWRRGDVSWFGHPAVNWPVRSNRFGPRAMPRGVVFGHKGPAAWHPGGSNAALLAVLASTPARVLIAVRLGAADESLSPAFEVGVVRELPWPTLTQKQIELLGRLGGVAADIVRVGQIEDDTTGESTIAFAVPPVLIGRGTGPLESCVRARVAAREDRVTRVSEIQAEIDDLVATAYGFEERDRRVMDEEMETCIARYNSSDKIDSELFSMAYRGRDPVPGDRLPGGLDAESDVRVAYRRGKQPWLRDEETLCRLFEVPPAKIAEQRRELGMLRDEDSGRAAADIVSWAVGVAFGRFDLRLWQHPEWIPTFRDAFAALPACPLGQLVGPDGLPAAAERIASEGWLAARAALPVPELPPADAHPAVTSAAYPVEVAWDGILVDDPFLTDRRPTFVDRVSRVMAFVFGDAQRRWEEDIAAALDAEDVAGWLRSPSGFFADHLGRYSKSRRVAPLYWPLSFGSATWWVYAPRFDATTLPALLNRLRDSLERLRNLREKLDREAVLDRTKSAELAILRTEIAEREAGHTRLSKLLDDGYEPHPDDGFVVTASPLHFAFRQPKWRDLLKATWAELERGDLDWTHLAMALWPKRVRSKCLDYEPNGDPPRIPNLSLACAHGLETEYQASVAASNIATKVPGVKRATSPSMEGHPKKGRKTADTSSPPAEPDGSSHQLDIPGLKPSGGAK
jgi:hypothetical protein